MRGGEAAVVHPQRQRGDVDQRGGHSRGARPLREVAENRRPCAGDPPCRTIGDGSYTLVPGRHSLATRVPQLDTVAVDREYPLRSACPAKAVNQREETR